MFVEVKIVSFNLRCCLLVTFCLVSPKFDIRFLTLNYHVGSDLLKGLSTFASPVFSSHKTSQNDFVFFHVREIPPCFLSLNLSFLARNGCVDLILVWILHFLLILWLFIIFIEYCQFFILGHPNLSFRRNSSEKFLEFVFLGGKVYIIEYCPYSQLENANIFLLSDGTLLN